MYNAILVPFVGSVDSGLLNRAQAALKSLTELGAEPDSATHLVPWLYFEWKERPSKRWASMLVTDLSISVSLHHPDTGMEQFVVNETMMTRSMDRIRLFLSP